MVTQTAPKLVTAEDLFRLSKDEFHGELIRGELCEEPLAGFVHGSVVARLMYLLHSFVNERNIGTAIGRAGVWLERDPDTVRAADVQYFSAERLPYEARHTGYVEVAPNLVIEVRSFDESRRRLHDKAIMWLNAGVQLVWVVLPERRRVDVYRPEQDVQTITDAESLDGLDVLPGFSCSLGDFPGPADLDGAPAASSRPHPAAIQ